VKGRNPKGERPYHDCEYSDEQWEFIQAVEAWKREHGIRFPASSDYLAIAKALGYVQKRPAAERACFRCKQKPAELSNGECKECHNAYQRMRRRRKEE